MILDVLYTKTKMFLMFGDFRLSIPMLVCLLNNLPNTLVSHTGWPSGPKTTLFVVSSRHPGVFRFSLMETRQQVTQTIEINLSDLNAIL